MGECELGFSRITWSLFPRTRVVPACRAHSPDTVNIARVGRYLRRRGSYIQEYLRPFSRGRFPRSVCHRRERASERVEKNTACRCKKNEVRGAKRSVQDKSRRGTRRLTDAMHDVWRRHVRYISATIMLTGWTEYCADNPPTCLSREMKLGRGTEF